MLLAGVGGGKFVHVETGTTLDIIIMILYFLFILAFGFYFSKYVRTTTDYFFSGQRFHWWLITLSIVATGVGSYSFIKYSTKGFEYGLSSSMTYINDWFFMPFFMFGWLPIIYYTRMRSIPEYFERRFNRTVRILTSILTLLYMLGYIGINLLTLGTALHQLMGLDLNTSVLLIAVITGVYVTFGGQTAVIFTDLLQGFVLIFAGFWLFFIGASFLGGLFGTDLLGGFKVLWDVLPKDARLPFAHFNSPPNFNFVGIFWEDGIAGSLGFLFVNQGLIMRFLACKGVNEGRKAIAINTMIFLPLSAIVVANAGWIGKAMAELGILPPSVKVDEVFVEVAQRITSPGVFGFIMAALSAALMSTLDTLVNAVSAIFVNDLYQPYVKQRSEKHYLYVAKLVSAAAMTIGVLLVPIFNSFGSIYQAHGKFLATVTPPMIVAIFLGAFWKRFNTPAAIWTIILGSAAIIIGDLFPSIKTPIAHGISPEGGYSYISALFNVGACTIIGVIVAFLTPPPDPEKIRGFTVWDIEWAKRIFKGGEPNYRPGKKVFLQRWEVDETQEEKIARFSPEDMETMAAEVGDLVYIEDKRWWLGGLKSVHARIGEPHNKGKGVVILSRELAESGQFVKGKVLRAEKEM